MPNQPKNLMLGWRPPAELSAWARAEAKRRGIDLKVILDEALSDYRAAAEQKTSAAAEGTEQ
jgi:hypothetical protein